MRDDLSTERVRAARVIAVGADVLQILLLPFFFPGGFSAVNDVIDVAVAAVLLRMVGWHWAFLPTFVAELVPFVDLVPSWTAAVLIATRRGGVAPGAPAVVVEAQARPIDTPPALPPHTRAESDGGPAAQEPRRSSGA